MILDTDNISEELYNLLIKECKEQYLKSNKEEEIFIDEIKISFEVEQ